MPVAVKEVWLPSATSEEEHAQRLRRAEREARSAARLRSHPHIVTVHDVVIEDQAPWIVMELVDGGTLAELIARDGPLPPGAVTSAARGLPTAAAPATCTRSGVTLYQALEGVSPLHRDTPTERPRSPTRASSTISARRSPRADPGAGRSCLPAPGQSRGDVQERLR